MLPNGGPPGSCSRQRAKRALRRAALLPAGADVLIRANAAKGSSTRLRARLERRAPRDPWPEGRRRATATPAAATIPRHPPARRQSSFILKMLWNGGQMSVPRLRRTWAAIRPAAFRADSRAIDAVIASFPAAGPNGPHGRREYSAWRAFLPGTVICIPRTRRPGIRAHMLRPHGAAFQSLASPAAAVKRYQRLPEAEPPSCSSGTAAGVGCGTGSLSKSSPRSSLSACCKNQSSRMRQEAAAVYAGEE